MNGARFVHDQLERHGWEVACTRAPRRSRAPWSAAEIADAARVKGLAPLGCKIAAEIGDIGRFPSPAKLTGYSGLCPRVYQSGECDRRGPLSKRGPKYLRWALVEATTHACTHPLYRERYQRTKTRLGRQRGPKVAQVDLARRLATAIWHMLTRNRPFAPAGATPTMAA
jgi:transposase